MATGIKLSEDERVSSHETKFVQKKKVGEKASLLGNLKMTWSRLRSKTKRNTCRKGSFRRLENGIYNDHRDHIHYIPENSHEQIPSITCKDCSVHYPTSVGMTSEFKSPLLRTASQFFMFIVITEHLSPSHTEWRASTVGMTTDPQE